MGRRKKDNRVGEEGSSAGVDNRRDGSGDYLNGADFQKWVLAHQDGDNQYDEDIWNALQLMCKRLLMKWNFYVDHGDISDDAVLLAWSKLGLYNRERGSAFNFYTTCLLNAMRQFYRNEKYYKEFKEKLLKKAQGEKHWYE